MKSIEPAPDPAAAAEPHYNTVALRTWPEVAAEFNRRHGTSLSHQRLIQIHDRSIRKLRAALAEFAPPPRRERSRRAG